MSPSSAYDDAPMQYNRIQSCKYNTDAPIQNSTLLDKSIANHLSPSSANDDAPMQYNTMQ